MDGSIKVEQAQATSGGPMPRRSLRNIGLLATCQALTQSSNTLMFASSALAVLTIVSPDMRMWANLPVTINNFVQSPYAYWKQLAWSGALLITLTVLALNIGARILGAERTSK